MRPSPKDGSPSTAFLPPEFHPLLENWFRGRFKAPTDIQIRAWPHISAGRHVIITAPTGSGKTLTAFLWGLNQLITQQWPPGATRLLYVSPLKALNNDIVHNLSTPLKELRQRFDDLGVFFPPIRVLTRSGDTPQTVRRKMQRHPPEILITTPESLNLLLSSAGGRSMLGGLCSVILDEIHAVAGNKRGVHLITAVERLTGLSGEFQRIALSATIRPMATMARFVGGYRLIDHGRAPRYTPRRVEQIESQTPKIYALEVRFPASIPDRPAHRTVWEALATELKMVIQRNRTTLIFVNSRRMCEKLTALINREEPQPMVYAHHGSLSREIRTEVETKLKDGRLCAIVATNSLEMGIDIGPLDEVVLVQGPSSFTSAIQRLGRAGHRVGEICRGTLFPVQAADFVEAAVIATGVVEGNIESVELVECPLDVLVQILVSMVAAHPWDLDELYDHIRCSYSYHRLERSRFDLVINLLDGRYGQNRIRELQPRLSIDRVSNRASIRKGAVLALYTSGGTIPDRGYYQLRHHHNNARIGELDEEFVWEARRGQIFTLGTQNWKIHNITPNDVFVLPSPAGRPAPPFWRAEASNRGFLLSERIGLFLDWAQEHLADDDFCARLQAAGCMDAAAAGHLADFLKRQQRHSAQRLPGRRHLLLEFIQCGPGGGPGNQLVLHTHWGGRVNRPYALALESAWEERYGERPEIYAANDAIVLLLPQRHQAEEVLSLVSSDRVEDLLRRRLQGSGFFAARFRECAGRALLLPRRRINERTPLWMNRLRSQKLWQAVASHEDFPILLEAWRTCLRDEFDLKSLGRVLTELENGGIQWSTCSGSQPSPMASSLAWNQINAYLYREDAPPAADNTGLRTDLVSDLFQPTGWRPQVPEEIISRFEVKRQRLYPGYSPASASELLDWVKDRVVLDTRQWQELLRAIRRDHGIEPAELKRLLVDRLVQIRPNQNHPPLMMAREMHPRIVRAFYGRHSSVTMTSWDPSASSVQGKGLSTVDDGPPESDHLPTVLSEWLQYCGPIGPEVIAAGLGIEPTRLKSALDALIAARQLVSGELVGTDGRITVCDRENFETILRLKRTAGVPVFEPVGLRWLPVLLAERQGLLEPRQGRPGVEQCLEQLLGRPLAAHLWESDVLPGRISGYDSAWLDAGVQESDLMWVGHARQKVSFCFQGELDLIATGSEPTDHRSTQKAATAPDLDVQNVFPDHHAIYGLDALWQTAGTSRAVMQDCLWQWAWQGRVTNTTFLALRRGLIDRFSVPEPLPKHSRRRRRPGRGAFERWRADRKQAGYWRRVVWPPPPSDLMEAEELRQERVRLLLDRYGILFRELLVHEPSSLQWRELTHTLQRMELSGEILGGYFFDGLSGPQFISRSAFRILQRQALPKGSIYWLNAADPASVCGLGLTNLPYALPPRNIGNHLVYRGPELIMVSRSNAKRLVFNIPATDDGIQGCLSFLRHLLYRCFQPRRHITIERINNLPAAQSPYAGIFEQAFEVLNEPQALTLYRRHPE